MFQKYLEAFNTKKQKVGNLLDENGRNKRQRFIAKELFYKKLRFIADKLPRNAINVANAVGSDAKNLTQD